MSAFLLDLLPKLFNWVVVRGIGGQMKHGEPVLVLLLEGPHGFARVIARAVMDQDHVILSALQALLEVGLICL